MPGIVAALDADVLVPILACDFLLTGFDHGLYEPVVSSTVLDEVERTLRVDFPHLHEAAIAYRVDAMREALSDQIIEVDDPDGPEAVNSKDRHIVAAALIGEASVLVTNDRRLRQEVAADLPKLRTLSLDEFAHSLWEHDPEAISSVIDTLVSKRASPAVTREALVSRLASVLPALAAALANQSRQS